MSAWFFAARLSFGVPTPSEMFANASAPLIPVHLFGLFIGLAHGYTPLKILGFASVVAGQLAVGALGGSVFVARAHRSPRFIAAFAFAAWLITSAVFWNVLLGNYHGRSAAAAMGLTLASLGAGFVVFGVTTWWCARQLVADSSGRSARDASSRATWIAGAVAALVAAAGFGRIFARATFSYDGRAEIGPDVVALTPNERFYCVTKNFVDPNVDPRAWRLTVTGAVARPMTLDLASLGALPFVEQETTLMCINNEPGGGLMSNALWRGVPLRSLIAAAGPREGIQRAVLHAGDNYADTISFERAMEPTTLVAYRMNGVAAPGQARFPRTHDRARFVRRKERQVAALDRTRYGARARILRTPGLGSDLHHPDARAVRRARFLCAAARRRSDRVARRRVLRRSRRGARRGQRR